MEVGDGMFTGEYNHSIDAKGRLIVPAKLRELLGDVFVVTKGLYGCCLAVYPMEEWKVMEGKLRALPMNNPDSRLLTRYLMAGAVHCELDKQGRILLPAVLREFAHLEKEVVLAGVMNCVEIWDKQGWMNNSSVDDISGALNRLYENGINL